MYGCNEIVTTFDFISLPAGCPLPSDGISRLLQFISMRSGVNLQLLPGREASSVRQDDGTFIRANCAILGAIGNKKCLFNDVSLPEENMMPVRFPHRLKMKRVAQMWSTATNARSATASRAFVADREENAVALASVCHWQRRSGARLHSCRSADRLAAFRRQRQTEA